MLCTEMHRNAAGRAEKIGARLSVWVSEWHTAHLSSSLLYLSLSVVAFVDEVLHGSDR